MNTLGKIIANKYQLIEKLWDGRFYTVYAAIALSEDKKYIVKQILPNYFEKDKTFRQIAPNLSVIRTLTHPNIVSLIDYFEEESIFLVEEFYNGIIFSEFITQSKACVREIIETGVNISKVLSYVHERGVVHGMLTPESIIVSDASKIKISDFYALSAISSKLNITANFQGRDIRYSAPEIITGLEPTPKSDIYSLGMILYEMLTGRLPFQAENIISLALEKSESSIKSPRYFNPDIPEILETIILKMIRNKPSARYVSAKELLGELLLCSSSIGYNLENNVGVTLAVTQNHGAGVKPAPTDIQNHRAGTRPAPAMNSNISVSVSSVLEPSEISQPKKIETGYEIVESIPDTQVYEQLKLGLSTVDEVLRSEEEMTITSKPQSHKSKNIIIVAVLAFILVGLLAFLFSLLDSLDIFKQVPNVVTPNIIGKSRLEAKGILASKRLEAQEVGTQYSKTIPSGYVISQTPSAGTTVKRGRTINIVLSEGAPKLEVPRLIGKSFVEARKMLEEAGLKLGRKTTRYSSIVPADHVISQSPRGGRSVAEGARINLIVSIGQEPNLIEVPNLLGLTVSEAKEVLYEKGLVVEATEYVETSANAPDYILGQSVLEGTEVEDGTSLTLYVSTNPPIGEEDTSLREGIINFRVTGEDKEQEIVIITFDMEGTKEVYRKIHSPGENLKVIVSGVGKTYVKIYINGYLARKEEL